MALLLVPLSFAAEPIVVGGGGGPDVGGLREERLVGWDQVGFVPSRPESPAMGPDRLALGPGGAAAVFDPVSHRVLVIGGGSFAVTGLDGLAFTSSGVILVMDDGARRLTAWDPSGALLDQRAFPGLVPPGGTLVVDGDLALSRDVFGNDHPLATVGSSGALTAPDAAALLAAPRVVQRVGTQIRVDGVTVAEVSGERGGARLLGDWLIVESLAAGVVTRAAISLDGGTRVNLPARGRLYAPTEDVAVSPEGELGWIDPRTDGLHLVRVTP